MSSSNGKRKIGNRDAPRRRIYLARDEASGVMLGYLVTHDHRPCAFVKSPNATGFSAARKIARGASLTADEWRIADDLSQLVLEGHLINAPLYLVAAHYFAVNHRGMPKRRPGFDYLRFDLWREPGGAVQFKFHGYRAVRREYLRPWHPRFEASATKTANRFKPFTPILAGQSEKAAKRKAA